jgi:dipeptidyl aminopeptidase/acylaminoacyl peptidase
MRWRLWAGALALAWAILPAPGALAQALLPPEAHGRLPYAAMARMSPDGRSVAYIRQSAGTKELVVIQPGKSRYGMFYSGMPQLYPFPEVGPIKPTSVVWLSDRDLAISFTLTIPLIKGVKEIKAPMDFSGLMVIRGIDNPSSYRHDELSAYLVSAGRADGGPVLMGRFDKNGLHLAEVGLSDLEDSRQLDVIDRPKNNAKGRAKDSDGDDEETTWIAGLDGKVNLRLRVLPPPNPRFTLERRASDAPDSVWMPIWAWQTDAPAFTPLGFATDPDGLLGLVEGPEGRMVVAPMDVRSGVIGPPSFTAPSVDVEDVVTDPYADRILGFIYVEDRTTTAWLDEGMQRLQVVAERAFPDEHVQVVSWSRARDRLLVLTDGPQNPGTYWSLDVTSGERILVEKLYPAVPPDRVAVVRPFSYRAGDGLALRGYLTLPPGRPEKNLPVIIMPHGGPAARDEMGFDWWAQSLAARGYLVVQPNFRGSAGFGKTLEDAGRKQWGQRMQSDLSDALAYVVSQGWGDPSRVCIVGASYGGYAALAGATLTPDLYRCAVSVSGVSDLPAMIESTRNPRTKDGFALRYWSTIIGDPITDADMLRRVSPRFQAAAVKAPVLLIHGRDDTVVPIVQSLMMRDALQAAGKSVVFVELVGEDHYLRREQTRTQMLIALYKFLAENNPADP